MLAWLLALLAWLPRTISAPAPVPAAERAPAIVLAFGGDVALGRVLWGHPRAIGGAAPLAGVASVLAQADLAFVNLEGVLARLPVGEGIRLVSPPARAAALAAAGIDVVSLANNHALDAGLVGIASTRAALAARGIAAVGAGPNPFAARVVDVRGWRVAFLAVTCARNATARDGDLSAAVAYVGQHRLAAELAPRIRALRAAADLVVVSLHWGHELARAPSPEQRTRARELVAAGADLIVGHGPHVLHDVERIGDALVFYSLGDLLFDLDAPATRQAAIARVRIARAPDGYLALAPELVPVAADPASDAPNPITHTGH